MNEKSPDAVTIPLATIRAAKRLRAIDVDNVDFISVSMEEFGLLSPIWVREAGPDGTHDLIAGAHRLEAAKRLGWKEISVLVFPVDRLDARLMEIDENLFRRELSALDRAVFMAERKEIYEARHPETKHGGDHSKQVDKNVHLLGEGLIPSFSNATAAKLGIDRRTVDRLVARARKIAPEVRKLIAPTWIAGNGGVLDALARLDPAEQRKIVTSMLADNGPRSVRQAAAALNGEALTPNDADAQLEALAKAWRRAGKKARDGFLDFLRKEGALDFDTDADEYADEYADERANEAA